MKLLLTSVLSIILVLGVNSAYAETITETFETEKYGVYILDFQYSSTNEFGMINVFWNGQNIYPNAQTFPESESFYLEVGTDKENTELQIEYEDTVIDNIILEYQGQMSESQIDANFPSTQDVDPKDQRIAELEDRIKELEDLVTGLQNLNDGLDSANKELVKINEGLQVQVVALQEQVNQMTNQFMDSVNQLNSWFRTQVEN